MWREKKFKLLQSGAANATRKLRTRVESSPFLSRANETCKKKICQHCVPWWCVQEELFSGKKCIGSMVYARSVVSVGWIHFVVSMLYLLIVMVTMLTTTYNRRLHDAHYGFRLIFLDDYYFGRLLFLYI
jgi:hypothetical protein